MLDQRAAEQVSEEAGRNLPTAYRACTIASLIGKSIARFASRLHSIGAARRQKFALS